nr:NYN domain-containing protein [bacterium]
MENERIDWEEQGYGRTEPRGAGPRFGARLPQFGQRAQRLAVFVDVQNLFYSARNLYDSKINFDKLRDFIVSRRRLVRLVAYIVQKEGVDQTAFIDALRRFGYETKIKILRERPDGTARGDWDMGLAIDAVAVAPRVDAVALVTGDGDFIPLVEYLKSGGCRVEIFSFDRSTAGELKAASDQYIAIDQSLLIKDARKPV